jgi:hypothetical protein
LVFKIFSFSLFFKINLILRFKIKKTPLTTIRLKGSKISEIGSIIFLKKSNNSAGDDLESLKRKISKNLNKKNVTKHTNIKNLNELKKYNFLKFSII